MKEWQLLRCLYDPMGMNCIELQDPKRFAELLEDDFYGEIGWFIGSVHTLDHMPNGVVVRVEIEGRKENLEAVMELIQEDG